MVARILRVALCAALFAWGSEGWGQADPDKVLRVAFPVAETGFDPQAAGDLYSNFVNREIFDTLYKYDFLARPHKLVPNTATALPEISADGKTWTIHVKPGIYFTDDPAFKGRKRELTAADYVYSWKRILDPRMRSNALSAVEGRFVGAESLLEKAKESGRFDYDAPMEGLMALDKYTIRIKLNFADYELLSNITTSQFGAAAREVIEAYADGSGWAMGNPVGTGPYRLKEWRRGQKIVLEANPGFREERYPESSDPADKPFVSKLRGKRLPMIGRVDISIIEESNPRWLAFEQKDLDFVEVPSDLIPNVLDANNKLKPRLAQQGITLNRGIQPSVTYMYFNMEDPVVGGYTPERVALRRAIGMAYNLDEEIRIIRQGQGIPATQVIPPEMSGHNPRFDGHTPYNPSAAKALLDKFGYVDRDKDGWRELPGGAPLVLKVASPTSAIDRQFDELWQRSLRDVGIRTEFIKQKWPDLLKMGRLGQLQMWQLGNIATSPEGFQFLGLLYGGYSGFSNLSRFKLKEFDELYEKARAMPDNPERTKVLHRMSELVSVYAPWKFAAFRYTNIVVQPWVIGYKYNAFNTQPWQCLDIDMARRPRGR